MSHHKRREHHIRSLKIAGQTAGLVACIFVLIFIVGTGVPTVLKNDSDELIPLIPFLLLAGAGYIITWYREFIGALMMAAGGVMALIFLMIRGDIAMGFVYGLPFILSGAIYFLHMKKREQLRKQPHSTAR
ncbi:MAG: hypothetical protein ABIS01_06385 [Ferruginibacter sp.]